MTKKLIFLVLALTLAGCTQQERARYWGGKATHDLAANRKLVTVTWKGEGENLWLLTKPMTSNDVAETYEFVESSSYGLLEGTVIIRERK